MNRRKLVRLAFVCGDLIALAAALHFASGWITVTAGSQDVRHLLNIQSRLYELVIGTLIPSVWIVLLAYFGLYRHRYQAFMKMRPYGSLDLLKATTLGTLIFAFACFLTDIIEVKSTAFAVFWLTSTLATLLIRELLFTIVRQARLGGRNQRHLLIVGTNNRARATAALVKERPELGYNLRGFADDDLPHSEAETLPGQGIVSSITDIGAYFKTHIVDEVLITLPMASQYHKASYVVKKSEEHGIVAHFIPGLDFLNGGLGQATFDFLDAEPVINLLPPSMSGWQLAVKRAIDFVGAAVALLLLSPIFLAVAVAVKLSSDGPVFFVQERVGLNKRRLRMLKFRTMVKNAEALQQSIEHLNQASGPVFKIDRDPRVTPIGSFLRRSSLDELPQLTNVLRGDMSLVGPRPLSLRDYEKFDQDCYRRRFSVRPGITCLWQIQGRSSVPFSEWMRLDMEYIKNWSLWLDIKILAGTVRAVLTQRGAV